MAVLVVAGLNSCLSGQVQDTYFRRESGNWHTSTDWTRGVPNTEFNARFWSGSYPETQTITIDRDATAYRLVFNDALPDSPFELTNDPLYVRFNGVNSPTLTVDRVIQLRSRYRLVDVRFTGLNIEMGNGIDFLSLNGSNDSTTGPTGNPMIFSLVNSTLRTDYPTGVEGPVYNTAISLSNSVWRDFTDDRAEGDGFLNLVEGSSLSLTGGSRMALDFSNSNVTSVSGTASITGDTTHTGRIELSRGSTLIFGQQDDTRSNSAAVSGDVVGDGAIVVNGPNYHLFFTGRKSFTGGLYLRDGEFTATSGSATGGLDNFIVFDGGTFNASGFTSVLPMTFRSGGGTINTDGTFNSNGNWSGTGQLTKIGDGKMNVNGFNGGFSGDVHVAAGTLVFANAAAVGSTNSIFVGNNANIRFADSGAYVFDGVAGGGSLQMQDNSTLGVGQSNSSSEFSGRLVAANGFLTKLGTGTLTLSGDLGGFSGTVNVTNGRVEFAGNDALHQGIDINVRSGASVATSGSYTVGELGGDGGFMLVGSDDNVVRISNNDAFTGEILLRNGTLHADPHTAGSTNFRGGAYHVTESADDWSGAIDIQRTGSKLDIANGSTIALTGTMTGLGALTKTGDGALHLQGDSSSFGGSLTVADGKVRALGDRLGGSNSVFSVESQGELEYYAESTPLLFDGELNGSGNVYKSGQGELVFNGDAANLIGDFLVTSGTLSGTGQFGNLEIDNAVFAPGQSPGTVEIENLDLNLLSTLDIELGGLLAGLEYDQLQISGDAAVAGSLNISMINGFSLAKNQEFLIADIGGELTGEFLGLSEGSLVGTFDNQDLFITYRAGSGNSIGLFTAIPEPSGLGLGLVIGLLILSRQRQKLST